MASYKSAQIKNKLNILLFFTRERCLRQIVVCYLSNHDSTRKEKGVVVVHVASLIILTDIKNNVEYFGDVTAR